MDDLLSLLESSVPGVLGCLFMLSVYRAELQLERMRTEIAKKMNWTVFLKHA